MLRRQPTSERSGGMAAAAGLGAIDHGDSPDLQEAGAAVEDCNKVIKGFEEDVTPEGARWIMAMHFQRETRLLVQEELLTRALLAPAAFAQVLNYSRYSLFLAVPGATCPRRSLPLRPASWLFCGQISIGPRTTTFLLTPPFVGRREDMSKPGTWATGDLKCILSIGRNGWGQLGWKLSFRHHK